MPLHKKDNKPELWQNLFFCDVCMYVLWCMKLIFKTEKGSYAWKWIKEMKQVVEANVANLWKKSDKKDIWKEKVRWLVEEKIEQWIEAVVLWTLYYHCNKIWEDEMARAHGETEWRTTNEEVLMEGGSGRRGRGRPRATWLQKVFGGNENQGVVGVIACDGLVYTNNLLMEEVKQHRSG